MMQEWPSSSDDRSVASTARIVNSTRLYVTFLEDIDGGNGASIIIQKRISHTWGVERVQQEQRESQWNRFDREERSVCWKFPNVSVPIICRVKSLPKN